MRENNETVKLVLEMNVVRRSRERERPKKRWLEVIELYDD